ncbi:hypothetical protein BDB01DRAFT_770590 [Pilobolus umbonatus]|nr:hypothetical protein BDB01DRAFT_770590 [Pilobolus umbonatus]
MLYKGCFKQQFLSSSYTLYYKQMDNHPNKHTDLEHAPAQKVGGMRVKQPDPHRVPLNTKKESTKEEGEEEEEEEEEGHRAAERQTEEKQNYDMHAHNASRQADIPKNAGSHVQEQYRPNYQPRNMNH